MFLMAQLETHGRALRTERNKLETNHSTASANQTEEQDTIVDKGSKPASYRSNGVRMAQRKNKEKLF